MTADNPLDGAAFIVTGATREPGRTIVAALARAGAHIAAVDDAQEALQALAIEIAGRGAPGRVLAMAADLATPGMAGRVVSRASLAFAELDGLVIDAGSGYPMATPPTTESPFWDHGADPSPGGAVDVLLALAAPAIRQFRARGRGRLLFASNGSVAAGLRGRIATWAAELSGTGVTANLLLTDGADRACMDAAIRWLMSEAPDDFNGHVIAANRWSPALPAGDAAAAATVPLS